jgi:phosphoglycerol transferase MdoB-like AlkP superfamily enzyme
MGLPANSVMRLDVISWKLKRLEFSNNCRHPIMSSAMDTTLPLRQLNATAAAAQNFVSNNNLGAGVQKNFQQTGGFNNTQFNAETINYHGKHGSDTLALAPRSTDGSAARTRKDPTSTILHSALPSRSRLCWSATA